MIRVLSPAERVESESQQDMAVRGARLSAFKEKTADSVWQYLPDSGYWVLQPVLDGSSLPDLS